MGKWFTGGVAALAIWFGAAAAAEAQVIQVTTTGPCAVLNTDTQCTVTGTVSGALPSYYYWINIKVNGVVKHNTRYLGIGSSISKTITGLGSWGMQAGQTFDTTITVGSVYHTLSITIGQGTTYMVPGNPSPSFLPAARKEEVLCLSGSDEETNA